jgi:hypothetical protein
MGQAGYLSQVKQGGISTSFTNEPMTSLTALRYKISDESKSVFDRFATISVSVDGSVVSDSEYTVNFMFGTVDFSTQPAGDVAITGRFIPTASILGITSYSLDITGDILDDTDFDAVNSNGGYRTKRYGLNDVSITLDGHYVLNKAMAKGLMDRDVCLIELLIGVQSERVRGWFLTESFKRNGESGGLEEESVTLQLAGDSSASFGWL